VGSSVDPPHAISLSFSAPATHRFVAPDFRYCSAGTVAGRRGTWFAPRTIAEARGSFAQSGSHMELVWHGALLSIACVCDGRVDPRTE